MKLHIHLVVSVLKAFMSEIFYFHQTLDYLYIIHIHIYIYTYFGMSICQM